MRCFRFIKVKVEAEADVDSIEKVKDDEFVVKTSALRERGQANLKVIRMLSAYLRIPSSNIVLVKGHTSGSKIFKVYG